MSVGATAKEMQETAQRTRQLAGSLARVRADLDFCAQGGKLVYVVDFSEIYSFLHEDLDPTDQVDLAIGPADELDGRVLKRLALSHLFRTFSTGLTLLEPHAAELWNYLQGVEATARRAEDLAAAARAWIEQLSAEDRAILERLDQPGALDEAEHRALVTLMRDEASGLCDQVSELTGWMTADTAIGELRALVRTHRLAHRVDGLLQAQGVDPRQLRPPALAEERRAFNAFPEAARSRRRTQKMADARGLIQLRDANRLLAPKKVRVMLITRDASLREAAGKLARDAGFGWSTAPDHLRSLDEVLIDLLLRGAQDREQRTDWLQQLEALFSEMDSSLQALVKRRPEGQEAQDRYLRLARRRLRTIQRLWREHKQLRLSLAMPHTAWLSKDFTQPWGVEPDPGDDPTIPPGDDGAVPQLRQLVRFVAGEDFQDRARANLRELRLDLVSQSLQLIFLGSLSQQRLQALMGVFAAGWTAEDRDDRTLLRSTRYTLVCSVEFISADYRRLVAELSGWERDEKARYERLERVFFELVQRAAGREQAGEGFLFMAFVMALLGRWDHARDLAWTALDHSGGALGAEAHYVLAVVTRRIATTRPEESLERLVEAYDQVSQAIEARYRRNGQQDPRYLLEAGTIVLQWRQIASGLGGVASNRKRASGARFHPGFLAESEAVRMLHDALNLVQDDLRLEIDIRNNLAYAAATRRPPDLAAAASEVARIQEIFDAVATMDVPPMPPQPWPAVLDTLLLVGALQAREARDATALAACLQRWEGLHADPNLLPADRKGIARNIEMARSWLQGLPAPD